MKSKTLSLLMFLLVPLAAFASNEGGHGGGGVKRDGQYLTFASAGYNIKVGVDSLDDVPGMNTMDAVIRGLPIALKYKASLLSAALPSDTRRYFKISDSDLSEEKRGALVAAYVKTLPALAHDEHVVVFAVTDTSKMETYLLPEFFNLTVLEQEAILFHEELWLIRPDLGYQGIIRAEILFQKYLEAKGPDYDADFFPVLGTIFRDDTLPLQAALIHDVRAGAIGDLMETLNGHREIDFAEVANVRFHACKAPDTSGLDVLVPDQDALSEALDELRINHPDSVAFPLLYKMKSRFALMTSSPSGYIHGGQKMISFIEIGSMPQATSIPGWSSWPGNWMDPDASWTVLPKSPCR